MRYIATTQAGAMRAYLPSSPISSDVGQAFLRNAIATGLDIRCTCNRAPSSPLMIRTTLTGSLYLARRPQTEKEHTPRCRHGDTTQFAVALGLPSGSILNQGGNIVIDLDTMFKAPPRPSRSGGIYQHVLPNLGPRIHNLASFLIDEMGWSLGGPWNQQWSPWHCLQAVARDISISGSSGNLEGRLLLPTTIYAGNHQGVNFAKVMRTAKSARPGARTVVGRVLVAMLLPAAAGARSIGAAMDPSGVFGVHGLRVDWPVMARAWSQSSRANAHHRAGHPVLVFGMATVRDVRAKGSQQPRLQTAVEQLVLIPVDSHWTFIQQAIPTVRAVDLPKGRVWSDGLLGMGKPLPPVDGDAGTASARSTLLPW